MVENETLDKEKKINRRLIRTGRNEPMQAEKGTLEMKMGKQKNRNHLKLKGTQKDDDEISDGKTHSKKYTSSLQRNSPSSAY